MRRARIPFGNRCAAKSRFILKTLFTPAMPGACLAAIVSLFHAAPVHGATFNFTNTADSGAGSLRQAIADAALPGNPGPDLIVPSGLGTASIALLSPIVIDDPGGVTVDATALASGATVDGGSDFHRLLEVRNGSSVVLRGLSLVNGGGDFISSGGAISNAGSLTLERCTLVGNIVVHSFSATSINEGGAIWNNGTLSLVRCTFSGNLAVGWFGSGGAIHNQGTMTATLSTFHGNLGGEFGGAITNEGHATLTHCTLSGNTGGAGGGGGVAGGQSATIVRNCIIAGNGNSDVDMPYGVGTNTFTSQGGNLIGKGSAAQVFHQAGDSIGHTSDTILLSPLGDFGGSVATLVPLPGSPAIDAATVIAGVDTDQRGFQRNVDGNGDGGSAPDVGAVETRRVVVNTRADENDTPAGAAVSLREALREDAESDNADIIVFDPTVFTAAEHSIAVSSRIAISGTSIVDATPLAAGATITGGLLQNQGLLNVVRGARLVLRGLSITNGGGKMVESGAAISNIGTLWLDLCTLSGNRANSILFGAATEGGAIKNTGVLSLNRCILSGNVAAGSQGSGGAISNRGTLTMERCTLAGNAAASGGAVFSATSAITGTITSSTSLSYCTLTSNTASALGGAIHNNVGSTTLQHCTITGNTAPSTMGGGVASTGDALTKTLVRDSIIVGNLDHDVDIPFDSDTNSVISGGYNLIGWGSATTGFFSYGDSTGHTASTIRLSPLGHYGGPTQTMALRPGSPARDQSVNSSSGDQRGFPIVGLPDIGAYEAGTPVTSNCAAFLWETLPATATAAQIAETFDYDGDGQTNGEECVALTDPGDPSSVFRTASFVRNGANLILSFPTVTGRTYRLQRSDTLGTWIDTGITVMGSGGVRSFTVSAALQRRFFRVAVTP